MQLPFTVKKGEHQDEEYHSFSVPVWPLITATVAAVGLSVAIGLSVQLGNAQDESERLLSLKDGHISHLEQMAYERQKEDSLIVNQPSYQEEKYQHIVNYAEQQSQQMHLICDTVSETWRQNIRLLDDAFTKCERATKHLTDLAEDDVDYGNTAFFFKVPQSAHPIPWKD